LQQHSDKARHSANCSVIAVRASAMSPAGFSDRAAHGYLRVFRLDGQTLEWRVSEILYNVSRSWIQINGTCFNAVLYARSV
jgi:hypothetical protein